MIYQNADLTFLRRVGTGSEYVVSARAPGGNEARETVALHEELLDFDPLSADSRRGGKRRAVLENEALPDVESAGEALFDALFVGELRRFFDRVNTQAKADGAGLRLRLRFDLDDTEVRTVSRYPWELMRDPGDRQFLALNAKTPIVRYVEAGRPYARGELTEGLRVLVVMANVAGLAPLDLEEERRRIEHSWAGQQGVQVTYLGDEVSGDATPEALQRMIHGSHVLHFMGHGDSTGRALLLAGDSDAPQPLGADRFAQWLAEGTLRLVVLNACDAGRMDQQEPFSGFASRLVAAGVPAVVAMQRPISDEAAVAFSGEFYGHLARGMAVDEAVAAGRRAIDARAEGTLEWVTPVLFMRAEDGVLFNAQVMDAAASPEHVAASSASDGKRAVFRARELATFCPIIFAILWEMARLAEPGMTRVILGFLVLFTGIVAVGSGAVLVQTYWRIRGMALLFGSFVMLALPIALLFDEPLLLPGVGLASWGIGTLVSRRSVL